MVKKLNKSLVGKKLETNGGGYVIFFGSAKDLKILNDEEGIWAGHGHDPDGTPFCKYNRHSYNYWDSDGTWRGFKVEKYDLKVPFRVWGYKDNLYNDE
jgi:hypothetical protein